MLHFRLFNRHYFSKQPITGVIIPKDLEFLRGQYTNNKDKIENYYLTRNFAVQGEHILSTILEMFPLMLESDYYDYLNVLDARIPYIAKHMNFTQGNNAGIVHKPFFYGNGGQSIILTEYEIPNEKIMEQDWRTISCCRALTHPRNDRKLLLPFGKNDGSKAGYDVVVLNLYKLAIKYREFYKEQQAKLKRGETLNSNKTNFVSKYVIPGFLESDIDHRFLNIIMDTYYGNPIIEPNYRHQFPLIEATPQFNRYVSQTLEAITTKDMNFYNILNNIHLIFKVNALDLLALDNIEQTRQSNWALITARLRYMCFVYDVAFNKDKSRDIIADWKLLVKRFEMDNAMLGKFNNPWKAEIEGYMDKIRNM